MTRLAMIEAVRLLSRLVTGLVGAVSMGVTVDVGTPYPLVLAVGFTSMFSTLMVMRRLIRTMQDGFDVSDDVAQRTISRLEAQVAALAERERELLGEIERMRRHVE